MKLIVSLHDVAPPFEQEIRRQITLLRAAGVNRLVLKTVPNWHGAYPLAGSASLVSLLQDEAARGSQIVLHGLEHRPHGALRGGLLQRTRGALFAADTAEFLTLSGAEAAQFARAGIDAFVACALPSPSTFCPPGWLMTPEAQQGVAAAGVRRIVSMYSLRDLGSKRRHVFAGSGYMGAGAWQERGIGALNALIAAAWLPRAPVVRIFLHPQHAPNRALDTAICRVAALIERGWHPITFDEL